MSKSLAKRTKNLPKNMILVKIIELIDHFLCAKERMSNLLRKNDRFAHLLIYHERPERIAHGHTFVMSGLSDSLTITLLT